ncbi:MarR family winged helix-turn-helix transcriptional regulator [Anaerocolumna xylanovorans]|uniref:DNA-binding transcriptional regulator, MarR family n=1 Tax=Anaerocolumna xylanovorans DSM 12503 TaxID=1121345 RepID=A0A1M7YK59_9FIRM|nr:MarR family transcriptional regulator [Anaerocolumna xylanovorans]SHO53004.1 DNA-binding transcriptional regulator, MarR family [Anaerocolumna xylanovorans DSM 12503]
MENKTLFDTQTEVNIHTLRALNRCSQHVHRKELSIIKDSGLTASQFEVLEVLYDLGDLRICDIIEKILATGGNMTVVIDNLAKDGLIQQCTDPQDKRVKLIRITDKGKSLMDDLIPRYLDNINSIFKELSESEKQSLREILVKLSGVS